MFFDMADEVDAHAVGLCVATIATEAERAEMTLDFPFSGFHNRCECLAYECSPPKRRLSISGTLLS